MTKGRPGAMEWVFDGVVRDVVKYLGRSVLRAEEFARPSTAHGGLTKVGTRATLQV